MAAFSFARDFLQRAFLAPLGSFFRHVFSFLPAALVRHLPPSTHAAPPANMPRAKGSKALDLAADGQRRQMLHIKTKEECRLANETIDVWSVELPSKHAESILRIIKENIEGQDSVDLQHLRRFARPRYIPKHVVGQRDLIKEMHAVSRTWDAAPGTVMQNPTTNSWEPANPAKKSAPTAKAPTLYLLVCPAIVISLPDLHSLLMKYPPFTTSAESWAYPLEIKKVTVPRQPPTKPEQATEWSEKYWPTFYRKTNPFGAHPGTIAKAESDLKHPLIGNLGMEDAMALAEQAAEETTAQGYGVSTGCVIVERVDDKTQVIAAAGDARYKPMSPAHQSADEAKKDPGCKGNPMCHAVMRAIGMVGRKRLRVATQLVSKAANKGERALAKAGLNQDEAAHDAFFLDRPVNDFEEQYFKRDNLKPDGYLCLKLEVFLTHEPCVMCSMALVHSRVGRVVFKNRMPQTGGLTAEVVSNDTGPVGLGYGLCWRKELNWQFMCWEYAPVDQTGKPLIPGRADSPQEGDASARPAITNDHSSSSGNGTANNGWNDNTTPNPVTNGTTNGGGGGSVARRKKNKKKAGGHGGAGGGGRNNGGTTTEKYPAGGDHDDAADAPKTYANNPYVSSFARTHV